MLTELRIGILVGSNRAGSFNQRLADVAAGLSEHETVRVTGLDALPFFSEDLESDTPESVVRLREAVAAVDAVLVVTPEYNATMPALMKNAIDWMSRPRGTAELQGKAAAVIGASPSPGGAARAVADAVRSLRQAGATVLDQTVTVPSAHVALAGEVSPELSDQLTAVLAQLTAGVDDSAAAA